MILGHGITGLCIRAGACRSAHARFLLGFPARGSEAFAQSANEFQAESRTAFLHGKGSTSARLRARFPGQTPRRRLREWKGKDQWQVGPSLNETSGAWNSRSKARNNAQSHKNDTKNGCGPHKGPRQAVRKMTGFWQHPAGGYPLWMVKAGYATRILDLLRGSHAGAYPRSFQRSNYQTSRQFAGWRVRS